MTALAGDHITARLGGGWKQRKKKTRGTCCALKKPEKKVPGPGRESQVLSSQVVFFDAGIYFCCIVETVFRRSGFYV